MKLIIDIPNEAYNVLLTEQVLPSHIDVEWLLIHGIPLDDVKAEIKEARLFHVGTFEDDNPIDYGIVEGFDKTIAILDNIGKAESEDKEWTENI